MTDAIIDPAVLHQFDICHKVGQGAYGIVWKAKHRTSDNHHGGHGDNDGVVALKKCFEAFRCDVDAQRTYREVMYLKALSCGKGHPNIVKLFDIIRADNDRDLYITFEYLETDLSQVIKAHILEPLHIQYIIYQLLKALKFLHSAALLHRDLKPSNILVNSSCGIKLCDFGLCRSIAAEEQQKQQIENMVLTDYVATRWYRPPEVLMGSRRYNEGIDLWSVGCILGEMFRGSPLLPGRSTLGQVELIFEMTGNPHAKDVKSWQSPFSPAMLAKVQAKRHVKLDELCKRLPRNAKHLMKDLFKLDPKKRGTAASALEHEYLADFHDPEKEIVYPHGSIRIGVNDNAKLRANDYRQKLYHGIEENTEYLNENVMDGRCSIRTIADAGINCGDRTENDRMDTVDIPTVSYDSLDDQAK